MKKILGIVLMPILGAALGGGTAVATNHFLGPPQAKAAKTKPEPEPTSFVAAKEVLAPLVLSDGRLAGYFKFDIGLEVPAKDEAAITAKLPLLLHAINMRTYRTPLAAGADGMLPDLRRLRDVVREAAPEAFGKGVVQRVAITRAEPA